MNEAQQDLAAGEPGAGARSSACPRPSGFDLATGGDQGCPLPEPGSLAPPGSYGQEQCRSQEREEALAAGASPPGMQCELAAADGQAAAEEEGQAGAEVILQWWLAKVQFARADEKMLKMRLAQARKEEVVVKAEVRSAEDVQAQVWQ